MLKRLFSLMTVTGAICLAPALTGSATLHARDWDDYWEDYYEAQEDYYDDLEDYYEDRFDHHRRHRVRYWSGYRGYPSYGWRPVRRRVYYRAPVIVHGHHWHGHYGHWHHGPCPY